MPKHLKEPMLSCYFSTYNTVQMSDLDSSKYAVFEGFTNQNVAKNQKLIFKKIFSYCLWYIEMDQ